MLASPSFFKNVKFLKISISDREIPVKTTSFWRFPYKSINFGKEQEIFVIFDIRSLSKGLGHIMLNITYGLQP